MFSRAKLKARPDDRYRLLEVIGEGGMGMVWKAFDRKLDTHVAVKTLLDTFDREAFDRFQGECKKLAGLPHHPNIIRIMDVGQIEQDGREKPFLVMPLLEGATLAQLLQRTSISQQRLELLLSKKSALAGFLSSPEERLSASRIVEIICQVCKGLQVAHEEGIIHRDIKPSNIFVLSDFSVQIIDFGVARWANANSSTVGWKGTLPYMSPEQVQFKPLTTASDIFSLGVVCYEALVGDLPFGGKDTTEVAERIVHHTPRVPHEVAPVKLPISQAVFKALAKQSDNRYLTAAAFADHLSTALALGDAELFPLPRPRLTLAADYHAKGNDEAALKLIETLSTEGISHPEISELRERIDSSLRRKRIEEGIAAGRSLMEIREYDQAARELKRLLAEDPGNPTALAILKDIDTRRTDDDVEELLRQTRRHMDEYDLDAARKALERVRKRRPREPRLSQFLAELDRIKAEYEELLGERQRLYDAVRSAFERRDISAARSSIQKLAALDDEHPDVPNPKAAEFRSLRSQVEMEQQAIEAALAEANWLVSDKRLLEALEICSAQIAKYPANEHFLHLQFQIEELHRQAVADAIRETEALLRAEPDLLKQEKLLESRTQQFPGESHFKLGLERTKKLRAAVEEIASRARAYEGEKAFQEAQQEWQKLRTVYPQYPGLDTELERVATRRTDQIKRQRKEKLAQQVHRHIDHREYRDALDVLAAGLKEFPEDPELTALNAVALSGIKTIEEADALLRQGSELCANGNFEDGLSALRKAYSLDRMASAVASGLVEALLAHAHAAETADQPCVAEASLREALTVDPDNSSARHHLDLLLERRHDESISACMAESLHRESIPDLQGALEVIERGIQDYGASPRLMERRETLHKKLGTTPGPLPNQYPAGVETAVAPADLADEVADAGAGGPANDTWSDVQPAGEGAAAQVGYKTITLEETSPSERDAPRPMSAVRKSSRMPLIWAACGVLLAVGVIAYFLLQPIPVQPAVGVAVVHAETSPLLKEPRPNADSWMALRKRQRVNILERLVSDRPFIRAQFVSPSKVSRPGYLRTADLGEWFSQDIAFSRDVVRLSRPGEGASEDDSLRYAEALIEFARRFPKTPQADQASLEAAQIYLEIASERKKAGKARAEWEPLIAKAEAALASVSEAQNEQVALVRHDIEELRQTDLPQAPPSPEVIERERRLLQMYQKAAVLYDGGANDEDVESILNEILRIDPNYDKALRIKDQIVRAKKIFKK